MKKLLKKFSLVASSLIIASCANIPPPKGEACVAFVQGDKAFNCCYDMEKDFDENGDPKPEAKCHRYPLTLEYFNKHINFDPDSFAALKAFALKQKKKCEAAIGQN